MRRWEISPTKFILPPHEIEPLLATHLEDVSYERETLGSWWQLPPWAPEIAYSDIDGTTS